MSSDLSRPHQGPAESKYWHIRFTNPSNEELEYVKNLDYDYVNISHPEINRSRPGHHIHIAIKFKRAVGLGFMKKNILLKKDKNHLDYYFGTKYIKSSPQQFLNYVIKDGSSFSSGDIISPDIKNNDDEKKEKMKLRIQHARTLDYQWFEENDMNFYLSSQFKTLTVNCQIKNDLKPLNKLDNYYIYGEPGQGKTSCVHFLYPGCYCKIKNNEKWDSYSNYLLEHETVFFDEMDDLETFDLCMSGKEGIKMMTDVYPFPIRSNYGSIQVDIRPKRFIITSNYTPSQVFSQLNKHGRKMPNIEMFLKAFNRRFNVMHITEFQKLKGIRFNKDIMRTEYIPIVEELEIHSPQLSDDEDIDYFKRYNEIVKMTNEDNNDLKIMNLKI